MFYGNCFDDNYCRRDGGYDWGAGMSNRAVRAYENGEMPISKWTKSEILAAVEAADRCDLIPVLEKRTLAELKSHLLHLSSWHHTSGAFNETYFYELRDIDDLTIEDVEKWEKPIKESEPQKPEMYVTAAIAFNISVKNKRGGKWHTERAAIVVNYKSTDKMVKTGYGMKRLSACTVLKAYEQKTCFVKQNSRKYQELRSICIKYND